MEYLLLFLAAIVAGVLNSVAGGGSFFTFPMLIFTGMNPIIANATNTMAILPGTTASVFAYRKKIRANKQRLPMLIISSLIGSSFGAFTLLETPECVFSRLIPYLLLLATLLFAYGASLKQQLRKYRGKYFNDTIAFFLQLLVSFYGGYFGGGMGMMILALLSLMGLANIHEMNAFKGVLGIAINAIAVCMFIAADMVAWQQALVMMCGTIIGGYCGATYAQRLPSESVRQFVIASGLVMTFYFFVK